MFNKSRIKQNRMKNTTYVSEDAKHKCGKCNYSSSDKYELKQHQNTKHHYNVFYTCEHCAYRTLKKDSLDTHVYVNHNPLDFYKCHYCTYVAQHFFSLCEHHGYVHNGKYFVLG